MSGELKSETIGNTYLICVELCENAEDDEIRTILGDIESNVCVTGTCLIGRDDKGPFEMKYKKCRG